MIKEKNFYKIVVLTSAHPVFDVRIFHKQSKSLANMGYDVTLIAQHDKNEISNGVKIIGLKKPKSRLNRMLFFTIRIFFTAIKQKAHVYHFHDPELIPIGLLLKLFTCAKVIYDVHEDYPAAMATKHWIPITIRKLIAKAVFMFESFSAIFFDYIIAAGHVTTPFPKYKMDCIYNYPIFDLAKEKQPREFEKNNYNIIYNGTMSKIRGIVEIVQSLDYIDQNFNVRLILIGKFTDQSEEIIRSLNGFSNVDFIGWVPHELVYDYLLKADIGIVMFHHVPNHIYSTPNKLFEYMSVGLPIVGSDIPAWKYILENCGIAVNPTDPKAIGKAIQYLIERPDLRRKMSNNGYKLVLEKYNWDKEAEKLSKIYSKILPGSSNMKKRNEQKMKV